MLPYRTFYIMTNERGYLPYLLILLLFTFQTVQAQDKPIVRLGGALRFNYNHSDWKGGNKKRGGDIGYDMFRINVGASYKKILLEAEYRFYAASSGGAMLKYGWIGYQLNGNHQLQLGQTAVPFGIMPYTANNYFFNINYYLGLEDDADVGIKYLYRKGAWELALAFFKNADMLDFSEGVEVSDSRYAYDVAGRNKETNQGNLRITCNWGGDWKHQAGFSAQYGGLYNLDTDRMGGRAAVALHYTTIWRNWDFKAQYSFYSAKPKNKVGEARNTLTVTAYGAPYDIAAKAETYIATLAYNLPIHKGILDEVRFYNDFSMMRKYGNGFEDSFQNITGCMLTTGPVYTYVDYALGKNHAWLGNDWNNAFASAGMEKGWNARLNINIGYYF